MLSTILSILAALAALCVLVTVHEFGHFIIARLCHMKVERFSVGFGPALWSKKIGETTYQIAPLLIGGYVQIAGLNSGDDSAQRLDEKDPRSYHNRPAWQRFLVVLAGPCINYLFAIFVMMGLGFSVGLPAAGDGVMIGGIQSGSSAEKAGLELKDRILSVNGILIRTPDQIVTQVEHSLGKLVYLDIENAQGRRQIVVSPKMDQGVYRLGIIPVPLVVYERLGIIETIKISFSYPVVITWKQLQGFAKIFSDKRARDGIGGPVQIINQMKNGVRSGWIEALGLMALISVALGFFSLLPIPALDGGRLIFLGWEIATRRPVSKKVEQWIHAFGMITLLCLFVLITARDILRLVAG